MKHLRDGSVATISDLVIVTGYAGGNEIATVTSIDQVEGNDIPDNMVVCHLAHCGGTTVYEFTDSLIRATDEHILAYSEGRRIEL